MEFEIGSTLSVPRGNPGLQSLMLDLQTVSALEQRMNEISYVTKETAPELMQAFNEGYCEVTRMMSKVSFEYSQATKNLNKRKGIVVLDVAPEVLKEKGLLSNRSPAGSEDLRKAVLDTDVEYLGLLDIVAALEAAYEFLRGKAKGFENAFRTTKAVFDITNSHLGNLHNLRSGAERDNNLTELHAEIGKPRYNYGDK